ncbi:MAG: DNA-binding protein [Caulobacteraceae bacterium]|nr:DNA-binding protein [Caulobacteraceae bacterium]
MDLTKYVSRHEAAKIKKVSVRTIDRWLKAGHVPFIWFRTLVMIPRDQIVRYQPKSLTSRI